jgi:hypothetical protein
MPGLNMKKLLPAGLLVDQMSLVRRQIAISARIASGWPTCPCCGPRSRKVHGRYRRYLADLPAPGFDLRLMVQVRRFRYGLAHATCCRALFSERLDPGLTVPMVGGRRTCRA